MDVCGSKLRNQNSVLRSFSRPVRHFVCILRFAVVRTELTRQSLGDLTLRGIERSVLLAMPWDLSAQVALDDNIC